MMGPRDDLDDLDLPLSGQDAEPGDPGLEALSASLHTAKASHALIDVGEEVLRAGSTLSEDAATDVLRELPTPALAEVYAIAARAAGRARVVLHDALAREGASGR
jgi:hypothetical protein